MAVAERKLMLFSIGPVQDFIAQARRTGDLWFGSFLLSRLSRAAAEAFRGKNGIIVYPHIDWEASPDRTKVTNKLLGYVESDSPGQLALDIRIEVARAWKKISDEALERLRPYVNENLWDRQIKDFIEFYAVWVPLPDLNDYGTALRRAEQLLTARKTLRDFKQNEPAKMSGEKKSSLDGGRESVLLMDKQNDLARFGIKSHETLDAISAVKRLSLYTRAGSRFLSVCDVAFNNFQRRLRKDENLRHQVEGYFSRLREIDPVFGKLNPNGEGQLFRLFYESRIEDFVDEHANPPIQDEKKRKLVSQAAAELEALYRKIGIRPTPYYAFLLCDGDRMGEALNELSTFEQHGLFTERLSRFADSAENIINACEGRLVYSGGDDVMAYLPIDKCLEAAASLQQSFACVMREAMPEDGRRPTLSIGIAVVHMMEMLGDVRQLAAEAERLAKQERNSLAIVYRKRNGGDQMRIRLSFDEQPVERLQRIQQWYRDKLFSFSFAYELRGLYEEYSRLSQGSLWLSDQERTRRLFEKELERLAVRKKPEHLTVEAVQRELVSPMLDMLGGKGALLERLRMLAEQFIIAVNLEKAGAIYETMAENSPS
ncbi:type III-B CRISPR-associated protein Cas10/Cmr2 [Paenibacillus sp. FSL R5-0527]|uniref:type III-B CRISPR-associated protein Cas10/Cmr2 n=1 Tax=Paenibacillus sp. FSL R5-0527 TaxID=2975321 RepID=UPI00097AD295|nr:type III-B CRISPR-associated protein Cas10/Cmr2 [Paenibacillus macerans]